MEGLGGSSLNTPGLSPTPMNASLNWTEVLSEKVYQLCQDDPRLNEMDCEPLVRHWLADIREESRPSLSSVLMASKRKVWNLSPIS